MNARTEESLVQAALGRRFYFIMAFLTAMVVAYGFSRTVNEGLIHPPYPLPAILYAHVVIFVGWIVLLLVQTGLVQSRQLRLHRRIGMSSFGLAAALVIVGTWVSLAMARLELQHGETRAGNFLLVPFYDMLAFAVLFGLGAWKRRTPEIHRRLMLMAAVSLTAAAFGRFPHFLIPRGWFYAGVDAMILLGVMRDLLVQGTVHKVYRLALPALVAGQVIVYLVRHTDWWTEFSNSLIS